MTISSATEAGGKGWVRRATAAIDQVGPVYFGLLFILFCCGLDWLIGGMVTSWWWHPPGLVNYDGANIGRDFLSFYSASALALKGQAAAAYDFTAIHAMHEAVIGAPVQQYVFLYPPPYLLLVTPLALVPYLVALAVWLVVPMLALMHLTRRIVPHPLMALATLIFPATAQCLISGQNGVISALIIVGGLLNLEARPLLAGLIFSTLTYKPHLAAAVFLALFFGRYWRALGAAMVGFGILAAASVAAFGLGPWQAFLGEFARLRTIVENGQLPWARMVSFFPAARLAGLGITGAYVLQGLSVLAALAALAWSWRRPMALEWRASVLILAIPLLTPYLYDYDLVMLILPLAWLVQAGLATGFRRGEIPLLAAAWLCPVLGWLIALPTHVQVAPIILLLLLGATLRRAAAAPAGPGRIPAFGENAFGLGGPA